MSGIRLTNNSKLNNYLRNKNKLGILFKKKKIENYMKNKSKKNDLKNSKKFNILKCSSFISNKSRINNRRTKQIVYNKTENNNDSSFGNEINDLIKIEKLLNYIKDYIKSKLK